MKIIFARHGLTDYNVESKVCGISSAMLTEIGKQQARALGEKLRDKGIDIIVCSPLQRAVDTAELANEALNKEIIIDDRFTEWDYGAYEGVKLDEIFDEFQKAKLQFGVRLGGGESVIELSHRVFCAIDDIREKYRNKTVLVICHGGVCRAAKMYFEDMTMEDFEHFFMENGEIIEYSIK